MRNLTQNLSQCILVHQFKGKSVEVIRGNVQWCKYHQSLHEVENKRGKYKIQMV